MNIKNNNAEVKIHLGYRWCLSKEKQQPNFNIEHSLILSPKHGKCQMCFDVLGIQYKQVPSGRLPFLCCDSP